MGVVKSLCESGRVYANILGIMEYFLALSFDSFSQIHAVAKAHRACAVLSSIADSLTDGSTPGFIGQSVVGFTGGSSAGLPL